MYFKKNLKYLRIDNELSVRKLAIETGIHYTNISKLENGQMKEPTIQTIVKLSNFFGVNLDDFVNKDLEALHFCLSLNDLKYVRKMRKLPFIIKGMKIEVEGKLGVVIGGNEYGNIDVKFCGSPCIANCHPTFETVYYDEHGRVLADYRG